MATVSTRILIVSDTHCAPLHEDGNNVREVANAFRLPLPRADLLIHCGDLTMTGQMEEYHRTLDMLRQIDAPIKLMIAGNHDLSLDRGFVMAHRKRDQQARQPQGMSEQQAQQRYEQARQLWTADDGRARSEGVTLLDEGVHVIELKNGTSLKVYASPFTPEFCDWAFAYDRDQDRFNVQEETFCDASSIADNPLPSRSPSDRPVDIVVSHGPPWLRLDPTSRGDPAGCPFLLKALMRVRPLIHCFGHIHEGWGAERIQWADDVADYSTSSVQDFQQDGWRRGIAANGEAVSHLPLPTEQDIHDLHAVHIDVSSNSSNALCSGQETLMINAAIMDVTYRPMNAPWLVDVDLPCLKQ